MHASDTPLIITDITSQLIQSNKILALLFCGEEHILRGDWFLRITRQHGELMVVAWCFISLCYDAQQVIMGHLYHCFAK